MPVNVHIDLTAVRIGFNINRCIQIISESEIHTALRNRGICAKGHISNSQTMIGTLNHFQFRSQNGIIHRG